MSNEIAVEEYSSLREELLENRKIQVQIAFASPTLIAGIVGLILAAKSDIPVGLFPWLLLIPTPLLIFSMLLILERAKSSVRIAAYIEKFLESENPTPGWESRLEIWREKRILGQENSNLIGPFLIKIINILLLQIPYTITRFKSGPFQHARYLDWNFYTITGLIHFFLAFSLIGLSFIFGLNNINQNRYLLGGIILAIYLVLNVAILITWDIYTMLEYKQEYREFWGVVREDEAKNRKSVVESQ